MSYVCSGAKLAVTHLMLVFKMKNIISEVFLKDSGQKDGNDAAYAASGTQHSTADTSTA